MLMLLSPAKTLVDGPAEAGLPATRPRLLDQAAALAQLARGLSPADLRALMSISEPLAALNHARFQAWSATEDPAASRQAALLFAGDVYRGLDAPSLSAEELEWAQGRLAILSGLYGVLRPLDLARPYRLEMGTRLATPRGADLYAWWGPRIAEVLRADLRPGDAVVNLASQEYFGAVDAAALGARVITPVFRDVKGGKARTLGYFAKHARGAMARWAIHHRVDDVEGLKACDADGYRYAPEHSTADRWEFRRPQPPPPR